MTKLFGLILLISAAVASQFIGPVKPATASDGLQPGDTVPGEILVKYRDDAAAHRATATAQSIGAIVKQDLSELRWLHLALPENVDDAQATEILLADPNIEAAQPNFVYRINVTPNDERMKDLYGMQRISAPEAWDTTTGSSSVVVAVIDTGIDRTHPDLAANIWKNPGEIELNGIDDDQNGFVDDTYGWDFLNNDNDPVDGHSHGTHCAGTIGGVGNNGIGVAGVNWNVKLMALKTHDDVVGGSTSVTVINTYRYVTMMRKRGINIRATSNSYGGPPEGTAYDPALKDAIDASGRAGVLNVFAAGNTLTVGAVENDNDRVPTYPGSYNSPSILTVAASDQNDNKASFSHFGLTTVDVAAPGVSVLSTTPNNGYGSKSGTSMSTPHTAGAAALIAAAHPNLSAASIRATLMNSVDVLPQWAGFTVTGGRINVAKAIANPTVCNFVLSQKSNYFQIDGGSGSFNVSSAANCGFDAYSDQPWLVVTSSPGSGEGIVEYTAAPNYSLEPRLATLVVGGQKFTVTQYGLGPVIPMVSISGRVFNSVNSGSMNNVTVKLTDNLGVTRQAITGPSGEYRFDGLPTGRHYTLTAEHARWTFEQRTIFVIGDSENVDIAGTPTGSKKRG